MSRSMGSPNGDHVDISNSGYVELNGTPFGNMDGENEIVSFTGERYILESHRIIRYSDNQLVGYYDDNGFYPLEEAKDTTNSGSKGGGSTGYTFSLKHLFIVGFVIFIFVAFSKILGTIETKGFLHIFSLDTLEALIPVFIVIVLYAFFYVKGIREILRFMVLIISAIITLCIIVNASYSLIKKIIEEGLTPGNIVVSSILLFFIVNIVIFIVKKLVAKKKRKNHVAMTDEKLQEMAEKIMHGENE